MTGTLAGSTPYERPPVTLPRMIVCRPVDVGRGERDMAYQRVVLEIGMGTDIRGADYTKAAVRALRDALWHNSLGVAGALGLDVDSMRVDVIIGVPKPDKVDKAAVLAVLPHGTGTVTVVEGGLEIVNEAGTDSTVIANAAAVVRLDLP